MRTRAAHPVSKPPKKAFLSSGSPPARESHTNRPGSTASGEGKVVVGTVFGRGIGCREDILPRIEPKPGLAVPEQGAPSLAPTRRRRFVPRCNAVSGGAFRRHPRSSPPPSSIQRRHSPACPRCPRIRRPPAPLHPVTPRTRRQRATASSGSARAVALARAGIARAIDGEPTGPASAPVIPAGLLDAA